MNPPVAVRIREADVDDAEALVALLDAGALFAKEDPSDPAAYRRALADIVATDGNTVLVAEHGGRVVGMVQLVVFRHIQERGGWCAEVESVHVEAAKRSLGIGTALMQEAIGRARVAGAYRLQLTSNTTRVDAHRWYRRLGFTASHTGFKLRLRKAAGAPGTGG